MLLEVGGRGTMGGVLSETIDLLKEASESIRLKIARPDMLSSVFAVEGGDEVCVWVGVGVCDVTFSILRAHVINFIAFKVYSIIMPYQLVLLSVCIIGTSFIWCFTYTYILNIPTILRILPFLEMYPLTMKFDVLYTLFN